jgi:SAM-dependent MidA family methyltransferase
MKNQDAGTLETDVPLSQSVIWRLQRQFYVERGLKAWTQDMVPNFITNNPFIAEIYARIVFGFLEDLQPGFPTWTPLRILELGAGPGKFSYLFLRQLTALLASKGLPLETIRYCMTDCSEALIESWRSNTYLAEFVQAGILEFELLELGEEINSSFLKSSGVGTGGPLVVIANYVFDSLPQDAFVIQDGQICEALITTKLPSQNIGDKAELSRLQFSYKNMAVPPDRYSEPGWNQILELYRTRLPAATVLFPSHALKVVRQILQRTERPTVVLAADKGFVSQDALPFSKGQPTLEFHSANCFSQMVNFDAISKYFQARGGQALLPDKHFSGLNICAFLYPGAAGAFSRTTAAYQEAQAAFGADDLFTLLAWLNAHMEETSVPQILAVLRLTRWDPIAFMRLFPVLARQLRTVVTERNDLRTAIMRIWPNHYPISPNENEIAFQCGVVLLELRFFEDALAMFKTSQRIFGPSAATSYNLGLCFQGLKRSPEALACMIEACELDPKFEPARISRDKLESERRTFLR